MTEAILDRLASKNEDHGVEVSAAACASQSTHIRHRCFYSQIVESAAHMRGERV